MYKVIIIFIDGEDYDGCVVVQVEIVYENGILIYIVGVGSMGGSFVFVELCGCLDYL